MTQFTPSIKRVSIDVKATLKRGATLVKEKQFDEAQAEFESVLQVDPSSLRAHVLMGNMEYKRGHYEEALKYFRKAIQLDPMNAPNQLRAGRVYLRQGKTEQALELFRNAIKIDPKSVLAYAAAGQAFVRQKNYDAAIEQFRTALRLNPQMLPARQQIALAYSKQGKLPEALAELKAALRINPNKSAPYVGLGQVYLLQNDASAAREAFQTALSLDTKATTSAKLGLAEALIGENRSGEAAEILRELPKQAQMGTRQHKLWGDVYQSQGLFKEAADEYRAASLLAAEDSSLDDAFGMDADFPADDEDEKWQDLANAYKQSANEVIAQRRSKFQQGS